VAQVGAVLTTTERRDLETLEHVVQRGLATFIEVGRALAEIRDRRLYRQTHGTFEEYCHEKWLLSRTRAYQMIDAATVSTIVDKAALPAPANEAQARELVPLLREDERQAVEVWRELRDEHGDDLTAERVKRTVNLRLRREKRERQAAERRHEKLEAEPKAVCNGCGRTEYVALRGRDGWITAGGLRGSHGDFYEHTYYRSCYLASGLAAEDARRYADDLDAGRGRCTHCNHGDLYGFGDGRYDWGGWVCARCEQEWEGAEGGSADHAQAELDRLRAKFGEAA
jgi:hypothetical protein